MLFNDDDWVTDRAYHLWRSCSIVTKGVFWATGPNHK